MCEICPQLLLSGQYFGEWCAYSLCRDERARGQRERGSVPNTPPAALVMSVLCSGAPTPSAEMRKVGGWREFGSVRNIPPAALVRSVLVAVHRLLSAEA
jgi:hypothetical protein